ncbi:hypothetical protein WP8S18E02_30990 [Aeromonas hydrophila]|nr:hypothetical protein WP8S18E02_30990 [Aeromonas hydrophila]
MIQLRSANSILKMQNTSQCQACQLSTFKIDWLPPKGCGSQSGSTIASCVFAARTLIQKVVKALIKCGEWGKLLCISSKTSLVKLLALPFLALHIW